MKTAILGLSLVLAVSAQAKVSCENMTVTLHDHQGKEASVELLSVISINGQSALFTHLQNYSDVQQVVSGVCEQVVAATQCEKRHQEAQKEWGAKTSESYQPGYAAYDYYMSMNGQGHVYKTNDQCVAGNAHQAMEAKARELLDVKIAQNSKKPNAKAEYQKAFDKAMQGNASKL